jgi:hypothetical protein
LHGPAVFILNEFIARASKYASDLEIFCRRRRHSGGRFFKINGAVSPSAPKSFQRRAGQLWPALFILNEIFAPESKPSLILQSFGPRYRRSLNFPTLRVSPH